MKVIYKCSAVLSIYLGAVAVEAVLRVASGAASVDADVEIGRRAAQTGRQVDAVGVGVMSL